MSHPHGYIEKLAEMAAGDEPFVAVTLVDAIGSTPQDAGSKMLVDAAGLSFGTVGGGRLENRAIDFAQQMIAPQQSTNGRAFQEWNLQRDVGMTCGGVVKLYFEVYNQRRWRIVIFGAGHVAQALARSLLPLDCHIVCIDPRPDWLQQLPESPRLSAIESEEMPTEVANLRDDDYVVLMTMGHRTDGPILEEILRQDRKFPYLGVIGSRAKRKVLERDLDAAGIPATAHTRFHCPIGLQLGSNQPGEIAISIAAQLIGEREKAREETAQH